MEYEKKQVEIIISSLKIQLDAFKSTKIQNEIQLKLLSEKINYKKLEITDKNKDIDKLNAQKYTIKANINLLSGSHDHYIARTQGLKLKIKDIEKNISKTRAEVSDIEISHRSNINSLYYHNLIDAKKKLESLENNIKEPRIDLNILEEKKRNTASEITLNKSKLMQLEQDIQSTMGHLRIANGEIGSYYLQQENLNTSIKKIENDLQSHQITLQNEQIRLNRINENIRTSETTDLKRYKGLRKTY